MVGPIIVKIKIIIQPKKSDSPPSNQTYGSPKTQKPKIGRNTHTKKNIHDIIIRLLLHSLHQILSPSLFLLPALFSHFPSRSPFTHTSILSFFFSLFLRKPPPYHVHWTTNLALTLLLTLITKRFVACLVLMSPHILFFNFNSSFFSLIVFDYWYWSCGESLESLNIRIANLFVFTRIRLGKKLEFL